MAFIDSRKLLGTYSSNTASKSSSTKIASPLSGIEKIARGTGERVQGMFLNKVAEASLPVCVGVLPLQYVDHRITTLCMGAEYPTLWRIDDAASS